MHEQIHTKVWERIQVLKHSAYVIAATSSNMTLPSDDNSDALYVPITMALFFLPDEFLQFVGLARRHCPDTLGDRADLEPDGEIRYGAAVDCCALQGVLPGLCR